MFKLSPKIIKLIAITLLAAVTVILAGECYVFWQDFQAQKSLNQTYQYNTKVLAFTKLFVAKVIKAQGDVSFDDRLKLENAVRDINDKAIFDQWQKFTSAKTDSDAQQAVKDLLEMLVNKISY